MTAMLRLTRGWIGMPRDPFAINLDGRVIGMLDRQQTAELPVAVGHHTLQLGAGRHLSRQRAFEAGDGQTITFTCHGASIWPIYLASLLKPDLAIALKRR